MDTPAPSSLEDILKVCAVLDGIIQRWHEQLTRGQTVISCADERTRITQALERLNGAVFGLSSLMLEPRNQAIQRAPLPFLRQV
ncbi:hypothetical protein [Pseudomonas sp. RT6P73]